MPFTRRYAGGFEDYNASTQLDAQAMNAIEDALIALHSVAVSTGEVPVWDGTKYDPKKITNAEIDAAAAIVRSKLALTGELVNADLASAAGIAVSKLAPGNNTQVLTTVSNVPTWQDASATPSVPVATIFFTAATSAPTGYLLCDGSAVSRTTYAALFTSIGETYGSGNGSTTFNVPDLRGRIPVGVAPGGHADVNAVAKSEGQALANRRTKHYHGGNQVLLSSNAGAGKSIRGTNPDLYDTGFSVGPTQNTAQDTPAFLVLTAIIKY